MNPTQSPTPGTEREAFEAHLATMPDWAPEFEVHRAWVTAFAWDVWQARAALSALADTSTAPDAGIERKEVQHGTASSSAAGTTAAPVNAEGRDSVTNAPNADALSAPPLKQEAATKPAAFIQHALSSEEGLTEELVFKKDDELEGGLYDYTPLYKIESLGLPDHDTAAIVRALRGKAVTISRTPYEDIDKAIAWVMGVGVGQALATPLALAVATQPPSSQGEPDMAKDAARPPSPTFAQVAEILQGIDATEPETEGGWWETSTGAHFGAQCLAQIEALFSPAPPTASEKEQETTS